MKQRIAPYGFLMVEYIMGGLIEYIMGGLIVLISFH